MLGRLADVDAKQAMTRRQAGIGGQVVA